MSKKDEKDVMSEIINDISSAAEENPEEAMEEAAEAVEEAIEEFEEAVKAAEDAETIVVKFDDDLETARAVRVLNKALRKRHETIYQGAVVSREDEDEIVVQDMSDMGFANLITGSVGIGIDLGRDGFNLVRSTAAAGIGLITGGIRLLRRSALLAMGLGGATWTVPRRKKLEAFENLEGTTVNLQPGETAVVIVADHDTAVEVANDLIKSGGELA
jgi:hypothetical protein